MPANSPSRRIRQRAQSVKAFTDASNQRKEAADNEVKISQLDLQIASLQQDLTLAQVQEKTLGEIIAAYGQQTQQIENSWKDIQSRIDQATNLSKDLLDKAEPTAAPADAAGGAAAPAMAVAPIRARSTGLPPNWMHRSSRFRRCAPRRSVC